MKVEQVPWLSSLDERPEFLGDELDLRDRRHHKRLQTQVRDVEERVADGEHQVLEDTDLQFGGACIGEGVEAEANDQSAQRPIGFALEPEPEAASRPT